LLRHVVWQMFTDISEVLADDEGSMLSETLVNIYQNA
jgi:hypothetical protein